MGKQAILGSSFVIKKSKFVVYAIVDIETSGGRPNSDKITEIAIYVHDGQKIIDQYATLINPECNIPWHITNLTGIDNQMVADAPKFFEVARKIVELTENNIFVAHNVNFDYNFVRNEFRMLGYDFTRETLCTVVLSRKLLPGHKSYSLGNICNDLNINIHDRHRASGDALATTKLFEKLIVANGNQLIKSSTEALQKKNIHPDLSIDKVKNLSESCGVYYLYNSKNEPIYLGKSKNIKARVLQHLGNHKTKRAIEMKAEIVDVDAEITGSELIALLKESSEIKKLKPLYNRLQRRSMFSYEVTSYENEQGYLCFKIAKTAKNSDPLLAYASFEEAKNSMTKLCKKYKLCNKLCGLYDSAGACFQSQIGECKGACSGLEFTFSYNMRAEEMIASLGFSTHNMVIMDIGRHESEKSLVWIERGKYIGYSFIDQTSDISDLGELRGSIQKENDNREVRQIIQRYLKEHKSLKIMRY